MRREEDLNIAIIPGFAGGARLPGRATPFRDADSLALAAREIDCRVSNVSGCSWAPEKASITPIARLGDFLAATMCAAASACPTLAASTPCGTVGAWVRGCVRQRGHRVWNVWACGVAGVRGHERAGAWACAQASE